VLFTTVKEISWSLPPGAFAVTFAGLFVKLPATNSRETFELAAPPTFINRASICSLPEPVPETVSLRVGEFVPTPKKPAELSTKSVFVSIHVSPLKVVDYPIAIPY
jgi:hypothetical protein